MATQRALFPSGPPSECMSCGSVTGETGGIESTMEKVGRTVLCTFSRLSPSVFSVWCTGVIVDVYLSLLPGRSETLRPQFALRASSPPAPSTSVSATASG